MTVTNFVNRTVWTGDNLHVLRGLNSETVDLIYLDPPFNSNKSYSAPVGSKAAGAAFKDSWTLSDLDVAWMGLIAEQHPAIAYLLDTTGKVRGKGMQSYLTMMAVRLIEMRRVLKPAGSIYLHCDDTASPYLSMLMDAVFGHKAWRSEIIWRRYGSHNDARNFGRVYDVLLYYAKDGKGIWNGAFTQHDPEYIEKAYKNEDARGKYTTGPLHAGGLSGGGYQYEYYGHVRVWKFSPERMRQLEAEGRIHFPKRKGGMPRKKIYLAENKGKAVMNLWDDINALTSDYEERTDYPTQKPLALLERIIKASSNEGDLVLDPFCGCATACVAAENLGRKWLGIDVSPKAVELLNLRLRESMGSLFHHGFVTARTDVPRRTDIDAPVHYRRHAHVLYGQQEGVCAGCKMHFPFKIFHVDHIIPQKQGGTDHIENLQLLCGNCNSVKRDRPMEYLVARLAEREGVLH